MSAVDAIPRDENLYALLMADDHWYGRLVRNMTRRASLVAHPTDRELQVLRCVSHGMTPTMAADALCLSPFTVLDHLKAVRYKLGVKTTLHAACEAIRLGLIA